MQRLSIHDDPVLESVNLWEPGVTELREKIRMAFVKAAIPLKTYAAEYTKHLDLHNLDIEAYIK